MEPGPCWFHRFGTQTSSLISVRSSTRYCGRPLASISVVVLQSIPNWWYSVWKICCSVTGLSLGRSPLGVVAPITCPCLKPPPAIKKDVAAGQWSRPLLPLIRGVRPNSPDIMMIVSSSRPRVCRSSIRAVNLREIGGSLPRIALKLLPWVSQPPQVIETQRTPSSISRRAASRLLSP